MLSNQLSEGSLARLESLGSVTQDFRTDAGALGIRKIRPNLWPMVYNTNASTFPNLCSKKTKGKPKKPKKTPQKKTPRAMTTGAIGRIGGQNTRTRTPTIQPKTIPRLPKEKDQK